MSRKENGPDGLGSLGAAASAALAIAINGARGAAPGSVPSDFLGALESLPAWRDDPRQWRANLHMALQPHRLPSDEDLASRSEVMAFLLRVCSYALTVVNSSDDATRHRNLLQASLFAGALWRMAHTSGDADALAKAAITANSIKAANARHKDNRADRAHVWKWLAEHRQEYSSDEKRADAIVAGKEVSVQRSTILRWIREYNREQKKKLVK